MSITHNTVQCLKLSHVCSWKAIRDTNFLYIFEKILFAVCVWNYTLILSASAFQSPWNSMKYPWKVLEFFMWILLLTMAFNYASVIWWHQMSVFFYLIVYFLVVPVTAVSSVPLMRAWCHGDQVQHSANWWELSSLFLLLSFSIIIIITSWFGRMPMISMNSSVMSV